MTFQTSSPAAKCGGKVVLLPANGAKNTIEWKIWVLSTILTGPDLHTEDERLLQNPARELNGIRGFQTDVFIVGAETRKKTRKSLAT